MKVQAPQRLSFSSLNALNGRLANVMPKPPAGYEWIVDDHPARPRVILRHHHGRSRPRFYRCASSLSSRDVVSAAEELLVAIDRHAGDMLFT